MQNHSTQKPKRKRKEKKKREKSKMPDPKAGKGEHESQTGDIGGRKSLQVKDNVHSKIETQPYTTL